MADENDNPVGIQTLLPLDMEVLARDLAYLDDSRFLFSPSKEDVEKRAATYGDLLGTPDYATQLQESKELAKMQLGLALAQRGFAAMGAQPGYGESPIGVLGRTLAAPLAGDVSTVAGQLMQQRQAARQAEEQLNRQTKLAALKDIKSEGEKKREFLKNYRETQKSRTGGDKPTGDYLFVDDEGKPRRNQDGSVSTYRREGEHWIDPQGTPFYGEVGFVPITLAKYHQTGRLGDGKISDSERKENLLADVGLSMAGPIQRQGRGPLLPLKKRSAFYWNQELYRKAGNRLVPGENFALQVTDLRDPDNRDKDIRMPLKTQQEIAEQFRKHISVYGGADASQEQKLTRRDRIAQAVKLFLGKTHQDVFGTSPGYGLSKEALLQQAEDQKTVLETAAKSLRGESNVEPTTAYSGLLYPTTAKHMRQRPYLVKVLTEVFPDDMVIENLGTPGENDFDFLTTQNRLDYEKAVRNVTLLPGSTRADHRAQIQERAKQIADEREKSFSANSDLEEEVARRLDFYDALVRYENAAQRSNVQGFIKGNVYAKTAQLGLEKWVASDEGARINTELATASGEISDFLSRGRAQQIGDTRISNEDALAYARTTPSMEKGAAYNASIIRNLKAMVLGHVKRELVNRGGVGRFSRDLLDQAYKKGIDLKNHSPVNNWHGHGYYGQATFGASGQKVPFLSPEKIKELRTMGALEDAQFAGVLEVPSLSYGDPKYDGKKQYNKWNTTKEGKHRAKVRSEDFVRISLPELDKEIHDLYNDLPKEQKNLLSERELKERVIDAVLRFQQTLKMAN